MSAMWTSKLGNKFPRELIDSLDGEHHRILQRLRKTPANLRCAECGESETSWASVNLGVFLCIRCADIHRALGTHISKVKGCSGTYLWGPDEISRMQEVGNAVAETQFGDIKLSQDSSKEERVEFCRRKYDERRWAPAAGGNCNRFQADQRRPAPSVSSCVLLDVKVAGEGASAARGETPHAPPLVKSSPVLSNDASKKPMTPQGQQLGTPAPDWFDDVFQQFEAPQCGTDVVADPILASRQQHLNLQTSIVVVKVCSWVAHIVRFVLFAFVACLWEKVRSLACPAERCPPAVEDKSPKSATGAALPEVCPPTAEDPVLAELCPPTVEDYASRVAKEAAPVQPASTVSFDDFFDELIAEQRAEK